MDDPNLYLHNEPLTSYLNNSSHSSSDYEGNYPWSSLPIAFSTVNDTNWKKIRANGPANKKIKGRNNRKRTKFSNDDLEILNLFFEKNPMPSRTDISILSEKLSYPRYIVQVRFILNHQYSIQLFQVWFYNKRQSLKRANSSSSSSQFDRMIK